MTEETRKQRQAEATKTLETVQSAMDAVLKPRGFCRHGRVFHRFVEGDISQVVELQRGQAYREETHLFWVNVGIRVPECALRSFAPQENAKKYHHEYECNLRLTLGEQGNKSGEYNLRKPVEPIVEDILARLNASVLPMFDALSSRDAILEKRMDYPQLWPDHLFLLEKAMIHGRRGELDKAAELFHAHYKASAGDHQRYLQELAAALGINMAD